MDLKRITKRTVISVLVFFCCVAMGFASGRKEEVESNNILTNIAQGEFKQMDVPLLDGIAYFQASVFDFASIAYTLALGLSVIGICWQAFRLWMGTQQVRKACTDIIVKLVLFVAVFSAYPKIVDGTINTAINIGIRAGGGMDRVNGAFLQFKEDCETKVAAAQASLAEIIAGAKPGTAILDADLAALAAQTAWSEEELQSQLEQRGIEVVSIDDYNSFQYDRPSSSGSSMGVGAGYGYGMTNFSEKQKQAQEWKKKLKAFNESVGKERQKQLNELKKGGDEQLSEAILTLRAMDELLSEVDAVEQSENESNGSARGTTITTYMYDPFIKVDGKQTNILSPGAMIKTAVLISSIIQRQNSVEYAENTGFMEKMVTGAVQSILNFIMLFLMTLGLVLASIFCVIQYIMCIFEYFIVTAVGVIFIPFMLFEGTKNFAAKLVTMFSSFFIKTLVMVMCLFWVYTSFLYMGQYIIGNGKLTFMSFAYFIFTCLLGWVVTQNAPQIAVTILNGSPQLSMGEFLHAAGTAAALGVGAKAAANNIRSGAQSVHHGMQSGVRGAQTARNIAAGAGAAFTAARNDGNSIAKSFVTGAGFAGAAMTQGAKNAAGEFFTGQKKKQNQKFGEAISGYTWKTGFSVGGGRNDNNQTESGARSSADSRKMMQEGAAQWYADQKQKRAEKTTHNTPPSGIDSKRDS